jgi:phosphoenolpyruvate synthase/pyruvate phosphate dikinase
MEERRTEFESNKGGAWPNIIRVLDGVKLLVTNGPVAEVSEGQVSGLGASPGVATGTARVIRSPEEFGKLKNGDILVAPFTNPIWTPLFAIAGGVVTEVGGMLSHGAIVAREYGIPAVMGIPGATGTMSDGKTVRVDGNRGIVSLELEMAA